MNTFITLEFSKILQMLSDNAQSESVKGALPEALRPTLSEAEARRWLS